MAMMKHIGIGALFVAAVVCAILITGSLDDEASVQEDSDLWSIVETDAQYANTVRRFKKKEQALMDRAVEVRNIPEPAKGIAKQEIVKAAKDLRTEESKFNSQRANFELRKAKLQRKNMLMQKKQQARKASQAKVVPKAKAEPNGDKMCMCGTDAVAMVSPTVEACTAEGHSHGLQGCRLVASAGKAVRITSHLFDNKTPQPETLQLTAAKRVARGKYGDVWVKEHVAALKEAAENVDQPHLPGLVMELDPDEVKAAKVVMIAAKQFAETRKAKSNEMITKKALKEVRKERLATHKESRHKNAWWRKATKQYNDAHVKKQLKKQFKQEEMEQLDQKKADDWNQSLSQRLSGLLMRNTQAREKEEAHDKAIQEAQQDAIKAREKVQEDRNRRVQRHAAKMARQFSEDLGNERKMKHAKEEKEQQNAEQVLTMQDIQFHNRQQAAAAAAAAEEVKQAVPTGADAADFYDTLMSLSVKERRRAYIALGAKKDTVDLYVRQSGVAPLFPRPKKNPSLVGDRAWVAVAAKSKKHLKAKAKKTVQVFGEKVVFSKKVRQQLEEIGSDATVTSNMKQAAQQEERRATEKLRADKEALRKQELEETAKAHVMKWLDSSSNKERKKVSHVATAFKRDAAACRQDCIKLQRRQQAEAKDRAAEPPALYQGEAVGSGCDCGAVISQHEGVTSSHSGTAGLPMLDARD